MYTVALQRSKNYFSKLVRFPLVATSIIEGLETILKWEIVRGSTCVVYSMVKNVRQGWKWLAVTKALAYNTTVSKYSVNLDCGVIS